MGLDMYLNRMPRYKNVTVDQVCAIEDYFDWVDANNKKEDAYQRCSFKEWCNRNLEDLPSVAVIEHFRQFYVTRYPSWDTEQKYGHNSIYEQVGYWRKANHIHDYFVKNVQDGMDDCSYHHEVTKEFLEELRDICIKVLNETVMMTGKIKNGAHFDKQINDWVDDYEEGRVIINPNVAKELLPTTSGFFFGSTDYDEWYLRDIEKTIEIINNVLSTTDFETQMIYYVSSW